MTERADLPERAEQGAQKPSALRLLVPALRRHLPKVLRVAVGAISSGALPPGAARALDGLLGGGAAGAVSSRALRELEAQVGSSQIELDSQLRLHREALAELRDGLDSVRVQVADEVRRNGAQTSLLLTQVADLRKLILRVAFGTAVALLLLLVAGIFVLRR